MAHSEERGYRPSFLLISYTLYFYLRARRCKSALCLKRTCAKVMSKVRFTLIAACQ